MMRIFLIMILTLPLATNANGQVSFSLLENKLSTIKSKELTELTCSGSTVSIKFRLKRKVFVLPQHNLCEVDGQTIQVTTLKFEGYKKDIKGQNINSQKQLLEVYSKYELDYVNNDLHIDIINPNSQWVVIKSKGWYIWYYRIGNVPLHADKPTKIQLFASTVVGENILTINAPIFIDNDFSKAGLIVNDMMETFAVTKQ